MQAYYPLPKPIKGQPSPRLRVPDRSGSRTIYGNEKCYLSSCKQLATHMTFGPNNDGASRFVCDEHAARIAHSAIYAKGQTRC